MSDQRKKFDMKPYRRCQIVFKIGLLVFLTIPCAVCYYKKYQKEMYARGMVLDMERISKSGRSIHQIPKYETTDKTSDAHRL